MSLLLRCARIVDGIGGALTEHGVLIEDARITRIAPLNEFEGYAGADMSLDDATLLPGPHRLPRASLLRCRAESQRSHR